MATSIRATLERCATRCVAAAALAGVVVCVAGLLWRQQRLGGLELLDSRGWYTPGEAAALFDDLDRLDGGARLVYAATGLTIDMAFPIAYGLLLAILLLRMFRDGLPLYLLPLAMAAADMLENMTVAGLALSHAGTLTPLAWLAAGFTLRRVRCHASLSDQGLQLIRDFSYPGGFADICGPGVGEQRGSRISTP